MLTIHRVHIITMNSKEEIEREREREKREDCVGDRSLDHAIKEGKE